MVPAVIEFTAGIFMMPLIVSSNSKTCPKTPINYWIPVVDYARIRMG